MSDTTAQSMQIDISFTPCTSVGGGGFPAAWTSATATKLATRMMALEVLMASLREEP
jgi:hypothetical protein